MSYFTIIEESSDHRLNVLLTALAKAKHVMHSAPAEKRKVEMLKLTTSKQLEASNKMLSDITGSRDGLSAMSQEAIDQAIIHTKHNIDSLKMTESLFDSQAAEIANTAELHEKALKEIEDTLHKQGATIQTLSTELSVTKYHGFNAFSKDGLLDLGALKKTVDEIAEKHFGDIEVHIIPNFEGEGGPVEINSYQKLFTIFYAPQDLEAVAGFFDEMKDVFFKGRAEALYREIMDSDNPEGHYYIRSSYERSDTDNFAEWLREYAEKEANHNVAYTIGGGDSDCLESMLQGGKSFLDKANERINNAYEYCPPQFKTDNETWHEWRNNSFGGRSGINKTREGYDDAYALSAKCWCEEHPELMVQADKLLEGIISREMTASQERDSASELGM